AVFSRKESGSWTLQANTGCRLIYPYKEFVDEGGLMSYGVDYIDVYRRAAVYVDKILKCAKPADLPVQQATKIDCAINFKAARQIGIPVSREFLGKCAEWLVAVSAVQSVA